MYILNKKFNKAFTLIELLVVVAIIGVLAAVVLASLNTARAKARDARRKHDIIQIRDALILYYDNHGNYPAVSYNACGTALNGSDLISVGLHDDGIMLNMPLPPIIGSASLCLDAYYSGSWNNAQAVAIYTYLENADSACNPVPGWYDTGSYCNRRYLQVLK